jgi:hypothetical protein
MTRLWPPRGRPQHIDERGFAQVIEGLPSKNALLSSFP